MGAIGEQPFRRAAGRHEYEGGDDVGCLTDRQLKDVRSAVLVGEEVDLGDDTPKFPRRGSIYRRLRWTRAG